MVQFIHHFCTVVMWRSWGFFFIVIVVDNEKRYRSFISFRISHCVTLTMFLVCHFVCIWLAPLMFINSISKCLSNTCFTFVSCLLSFGLSWFASTFCPLQKKKQNISISNYITKSKIFDFLYSNTSQNADIFANINRQYQKVTNHWMISYLIHYCRVPKSEMEKSFEYIYIGFCTICVQHTLTHIPNSVGEPL